MAMFAVTVSAVFLLLHILPWSSTYDWLTLETRILLYLVVIGGLGGLIFLIWVYWSKPERAYY